MEKSTFYRHLDDFLGGRVPSFNMTDGRISVEEIAGTFEISIDKKYFISVSEYNRGVFEVFTIHYNAKTGTTWESWDNIPIADDLLVQHKTFTSLRRAFNYAFRAAELGRTPRDVKAVW